MTESEFLALSPREQDALVAEHVMGMKQLCIHDWNTQTTFYPPFKCSQCDGWVTLAFPNYTTQIQDAWEVFDFINTDYACYQIGMNIRGNWVINIRAKLDQEFFIENNSAPLAICIAALKAKGVIK